ncbi:cytochrome-c peroxidase [Flavobacterium cheongpyeongense]|jgi:cytochrome c peroxidase|uniref:Cytochrome-c peroxidase n=1 Tax=Flavobacterium cheongpyeongense TaxID=2212651 RepID=A0A2V4BSX6_9FLAO|nr:cytochrome c peroxidase [Flavobacterium cheongpyeongense]PXY42125.1 cytochrome-c peroxidase [Flavobacterium cheongpyeongense]
MLKIKYFLWLVIPFLISCSDEDEQYVDVPLDFTVPSNFPDLTYNIDGNRPTEKGFELGKKLFYDGRLASDGLVSCGFCHLQANAFTHHGHTVSHGVGDALGTRNAPPIQNMAFQSFYMYDGAAENLDLQPIIPLTSVIEMNGNLNTILKMMKEDKEYQKLFGQAFEDKAITTENMLKALSQFMVMMVSSNSKFDKYRRNETGGTFSSDELAGYNLFKSKCASCHATDLMTDNSFRNNGLAVNPKVNDVGRYKVTEVVSDYYKFKVQSLRNVEVSAPYMHDGRFSTLEAVLNHYASGVNDSPTLDPILKQNGRLGIELSDTEKKQIITFLKTLTDTQYLTDKRFSEF